MQIIIDFFLGGAKISKNLSVPDIYRAEEIRLYLVWFQYLSKRRQYSLVNKFNVAIYLIEFIGDDSPYPMYF